MAALPDFRLGREVRVFVDPLVPKERQVRFPRSKKRRIRKKWRKNKGNYAPCFYRINGDLWVHPAVRDRVLGRFHEKE